MPVPHPAAKAFYDKTDHNEFSSQTFSPFSVTTTATMKEQVGIAIVNNVRPGNNSHLQYWPSGTGPETIIVDCCAVFKLDMNPDDLALKFKETKKVVTEWNKHLIKNGDVLNLTRSPKITVLDYVNKVREGQKDESKTCAQALMRDCEQDETYTKWFVCTGNVHLAKEFLLQGDVNSIAPELITIMHSALSVNNKEKYLTPDDPVFSSDFIDHIASYSMRKNSRQIRTDYKEEERTKLITGSMGIIEAFIGSKKNGEYVAQNVDKNILLNYFKNREPSIQYKALSLFNTIFASNDKAGQLRLKQIMEENKTRTVIADSVIHPSIIGPDKSGIELGLQYELYVLQTLLLNLLEERMNTAVEASDQDSIKKLKDLRTIAFESHSRNLTQYADHYKALGFSSEDPFQDFATPPGMLALDLMHNFANSSEVYFRKIVSDSAGCPFAQMSVEIVRVICEFVRIGEPIKKPPRNGIDHSPFYPMFFRHESPLEAMFSCCIVYVMKMWKDMRATDDDFETVIQLARKQIKTAIEKSPINMEQFQQNLKPYAEIREMESRAEVENRGAREGRAIEHLKKSVLPDILDLIKRQRIGYLTAGSVFTVGKGKNLPNIECRLSSNQKVIYYGKDKINISDLHDFKMRRDAGRGGKKDSYVLSFLTTGQESAIEFSTDDEKCSNYWWDGVKCLMPTKDRHERTDLSKHWTEDKKQMLALEIEMRLLDLEGIEVDLDSCPVIPPLPKKAEFGLNDKVQ